ncbi:MAG: hypothetical protein ACI4HI_03530 [Lachnospiraceae bacterium]
MNEEKAKNQILATASVVIGGVLLVNLIGVVFIHYNLSFVPKLLVLGIVFWFLYSGNEWARIAAIILLAIGLVDGVFLLVDAIGAISDMGMLGVINVILNLVAMTAKGFGLYVTALSPTVKEYTTNRTE